MVVLSYKHLDHIGAGWHFAGRTFIDARSNFEPIMQSVRDLNKLDDS